MWEENQAGVELHFSSYAILSKNLHLLFHQLARVPAQWIREPIKLGNNHLNDYSTSFCFVENGEDSEFSNFQKNVLVYEVLLSVLILIPAGQLNPN